MCTTTSTTHLQVAQDVDAAEFARFKGMLQRLQQAVRESRQSGYGDVHPQQLKNTEAFQQAGSLLRDWIERFDEEDQDATSVDTPAC